MATTADHGGHVGGFTARMEDGAIMSGGRKEATLMGLPIEIRHRIFEEAVRLDEPIRPVPVADGSNKFTWSENQFTKPEKSYYPSTRVISAVLPLAVVSLSQVSKQVYDEVCNTHIFYEVNHFDLTYKGWHIAEYLLAITPQRRDLIQSMTCAWTYYSESRFVEEMVVIAACKGLKKLQVLVDPWYSNTLGPDIRSRPWFKHLAVACQGLKSLTFELKDRKDYTAAYCVKVQQKFDQTMLPILRAEQEKPRGTDTYSHTIYKQAQLRARLSIDGEGRLGKDKKPGFVSSRTRGKLREMKEIRDDGTLPDRVPAKYSACGELNWTIYKVLGVREETDDNGEPSVAFLLELWSGVSGTLASSSWESLTKLKGLCRRYEVTDFYQRVQNEGAIGKELVLDAWKWESKNLVSKEELSKSDLREFASTERKLAAMISREEKKSRK